MTKAAEVVRRVLAGLPPEPDGDSPPCRAPGCSRATDDPDAFDGFCGPCAKARLRAGDWRTRRFTDDD